MEAFENSPEALVIKEGLREFFLGILENIKGTFEGLIEWLGGIHISLPPFIKIFGNGKANLILFLIIAAYGVIMNIKTYRLFKYDKRYAQEEEERIPEFRLLLNMWIGGGIGGFVAIYKLRHKTKHKVFTVTAKFLLVAQILLYSFLVGFMAFWTFF